MYSIKDASTCWIKANIILFIYFFLLLINSFHWGYYGMINLMFNFLVNEILIVFIAFIYGFNTAKKEKFRRKGSYKFGSVDLFAGFIVVGFTYMATNMVSIAGNMFPNPSFMFVFLSASHIMAAVISLAAPSVVVFIYDANVFNERKSFVNSIFIFIYMLFFGLSVEVVRAVSGLPWYLQRLAIGLFICFFVLNVILLIGYFDDSV